MEEKRIGRCGYALILLLVLILGVWFGKTIHDKAVQNKMTVSDYSIEQIHKSVNYVVEAWNNSVENYQSGNLDQPDFILVYYDGVCVAVPRPKVPKDSITIVKNKEQ